MKRFKRILLIANGLAEKHSVLERAKTLARNNQAQLTILDVIKLSSRDMQVLKIYMDPEEFQRMIVHERMKDLERLISPMKRERVQGGVKVLIGIPFLEIIREVLRSNHDLVMMTAEGIGGIRDMLFGTTTMHLMRKCPCSVWAIKPAKRMQFARILAAVDPDPTDRIKNALNGKVLELAYSLAQAEMSEFHVIHAWALQGEGLLRAGKRVPMNKVNQMVRETHKAHQLWLNKLLQVYTPDIPNNRVHLLKGDAGKLIPELASKKKIDLIVMGTVGRTGVAGLLIGNTAEKVLQKVDCSVLAVKPEGYVTPVELEQE
jgi:universal stress protein E